MPANLSQPLMGPFRLGAHNDGVRALQERLNEVLDPPPGANRLFGGLQTAVLESRFVRLATDGAFGAKTEAAVMRFQKIRLLRADGVVGPITAKALGFTQYTSLRQIGMGAVQLASTITGSLARWVPAPNAEPDLAYSALLAMAVQADVMRRMLGMIGTVPGLDGMTGELDNILAGVQQKLASAQSQRFIANTAKQATDYANSTHGRLMALSQKMQRLAQPYATQAPLLGTAFNQQLELLARQQLIMNAIRGVGTMGGLGIFGTSQRGDPGDDLLKLTANLAKVAKLLPHF